MISTELNYVGGVVSINTSLLCTNTKQCSPLCALGNIHVFIVFVESRRCYITLAELVVFVGLLWRPMARHALWTGMVTHGL